MAKNKGPQNAFSFLFTLQVVMTSRVLSLSRWMMLLNSNTISVYLLLLYVAIAAISCSSKYASNCFINLAYWALYIWAECAHISPA